MTISEKLTTVAENIPKVYEAGKKAENSDFWDIIQNSGKRDNYNSAFKYWSCEYIRPKYKVIAKHMDSAGQTFSNCLKLKKVEKAYFDFSQKPTGSTTTTGYYYTFSYCSELEEVEDIGLIPQNNCYYTFTGCRKIHTITKLGVNENTKYQNTFTNCTSLVNITIDGTIGQNGFDIHWSTNLSHDSLMSIINALADKTTDTGTQWVITLGTDNLNKLTDTEKATATQKGWTLA